MEELEAAVAAYANKRVEFRFRGRKLDLSLSHALFSAADVDTGTRFLLRFLSRRWDEDLAAGRALPSSVLDSGSGVGVIGIAVASALLAEGVRDPRVRAQDRDALAAAFTAENARANGIGPEVLASYAEPLLAGPAGARWDLILSNVPAKAGNPVLADFFARSSRLLADGGRALVVVVNPLAAETRKWIARAGAEFLGEEVGSEHTVYAYGRPQAGAVQDPQAPAAEFLSGAGDQGLSVPSPAYLRTAGDYVLEGSGYRIEALQGVADFDEPSRAVALAAKLLVKLGDSSWNVQPHGPAVLVHECDQGHFPAWLVSRTKEKGAVPPRLTLIARNVLALAAAGENTFPHLEGKPSASVSVIPAADLALAADRILAARGNFDLVVSFPEAVPRVDRSAAAWAAVGRLLTPGGLFLVAQTSTEAERFDRAKIRGFTRSGDLKRDGFRALAYRKY